MSQLVPAMATDVYGKWILAGEHAVLRGCPALVFPVFSRRLSLSYHESREPLSVEFVGDHGGELRLLFWGVVEKALELTGHARSEASGHFRVESNVPLGAGMGASATLCVAVGRWFEWKKWVSADELPEFCRQLENMFHGESSGVDIAVAISGRGLYYERSGERSAFDTNWKPEWYISYSGKRGVTSECVARVKELWQRDRALGEKIDRDMKEAVLRAKSALLEEAGEESFDKLASAIDLARSCFEHWGLTSGMVGTHMQMLMSQGAYAVKPTGSGDGGYVLSLWRTTPPMELRSQLISLNSDQSS